MNVEIAERLATRRKEAGLSQESLAEKLGVSRQAVSKWERSESSPDTDNLIALAKLYGVSLDSLLYVDGSIEDDVAFEAADRAAQNNQVREASENLDAHLPEHYYASQPGEAHDSSNTAQSSSETNSAEPQKTHPQSNVSENKTSANKEYVNISHAGIHVEDGQDSVHISWKDGVHVNSGRSGDEVHVGWDGVHVKEAKAKARKYRHDKESSGEWVDNEGNSFYWNNEGVTINGEHFDSWQEAHHKYKHWPFVNAMSEKSALLKFPFPLVVIVAYLLIGFYTNEWAIGLFVFFAIPLYYLIATAIYKKSIVPFISAAYPIAVVGIFLYVAFVLGQPHPTWVLFLTIPIVEWIIHACSQSAQRRKKNKEENACNYKDSSID